MVNFARQVAHVKTGLTGKRATVLPGIISVGTDGITFASGFVAPSTKAMPVVDEQKVFGQAPPDSGSAGTSDGGTALEACRQGSQGECLNGGAFCAKASGGQGTCTSTNSGCYCL